MNQQEQRTREFWERSFGDQVAQKAFNTAPVEAVVRNVSYYLRQRFKGDELERLHFLEMGCGAGPNLVWLARQGIRVSGIDLSPTALDLARRNLDAAGVAGRVDRLLEGSVARTQFADAEFDGVIEACVFQHLSKRERDLAFGEVRRLLKPGGLFAGYMLDIGHTLYRERHGEEPKDDPGTLVLSGGPASFHLESLGLTHFYRHDEIVELLSGFAVVDPCLTTYYLPAEEAQRRGYARYLQSMWAVYAIK